MVSLAPRGYIANHTSSQAYAQGGPEESCWDWEGDGTPNWKDNDDDNDGIPDDQDDELGPQGGYEEEPPIDEDWEEEEEAAIMDLIGTDYKPGGKDPKTGLDWWRDVTITPRELRDAQEMGRQYRRQFPVGLGDIRDAQRHAEWSKAVTEKHGAGTATVAGWTYEIEGALPSNRGRDKPLSEYIKESRMDLNNNRVGREAAQSNSTINNSDLSTLDDMKGPY